MCHCGHLEQLGNRVTVLEGAAAQPPGPGRQSRPPLIPTRDDGDHWRGEDSADAQDYNKLPLENLGPIGCLNSDKQLYDDKLTTQNEYRFDGVKGGIAWKSKIGRYLMSKVPAMKKLLKWSEKMDMRVVTEALAERAVGTAMTYTQLQTLNAAVWGFLSGCVSGTAETMFNQAEELNGLDAWRRIVRIIDHGLPLKLEELRQEVRVIHTKPIKDLESVPVGIAEFEAKIKEYSDAGGKGFNSNDEMKSDLLAILPYKLREDLLWSAQDPRDYQQFRDMVISQAAKTLFNRRRGGGMNAIDHGHGAASDSGEEITAQVTNVEELIAAFNRLQSRERGRPQQRDRPPARESTTAPRRSGPTGPRPPRRCANCGEQHEQLICPHPTVPVGDRRCWDCKQKGHTANRCPKKSQSRPLKAVEDIEEMPFFAVEDADGFRRPRKTARPMPRPATLHDFVGKSFFDKLGQPDEDEKDTRDCYSLGEGKWAAPRRTQPWKSAAKEKQLRMKAERDAKDDMLTFEALQREFKDLDALLHAGDSTAGNKEHLTTSSTSSPGRR